MGHQTPFPPSPPSRNAQVPRFGSRNDELMAGSKTVFEFRGDAADLGAPGGSHGTFVGGEDLDLGGSGIRESNLRSGGMTWVLVLFGGIVLAGAGAFLAMRSPEPVAEVTVTDPPAPTPAPGVPVAGAPVADAAAPGAPVADAAAPGAPVADTPGQPAAPTPAPAPETPATAAPAKGDTASDAATEKSASTEKAAPATEKAADAPAEKPKASSTKSTAKPAPKPAAKPEKPKEEKKRLSSTKSPRDSFGKLPPPPT